VGGGELHASGLVVGLLGADGSPSIIQIVFESVWAALGMVLGMFFLTPFRALCILVSIGVWSLVWTWFNAATGRKRGEPGVIRYVTGPLGSGKSLYASRLIGRSLMRGRPVVSNVRLVDDWPRVLSGRFLAHRLNPRKRRAYEDRIVRYYHYEPEISRIIEMQLHGKGEGRGLMVIDEVDNEINNRQWQKDGQQVFLRKLRMARKRGWVVYLLSQHMENTDKSARRIALENVRLVNWQQLVKVPLIGVPLLPFPVFLALTYRNADSLPAAISGQGAGREKCTGRVIFRLGWYKNLYNTFQDFALDDAVLDGEIVDEALYLPLPAADRPAIHRGRRRGWRKALPAGGESDV